MPCFSKSLGFRSRRIPGFRQHLFRYGLCGGLAVQTGLFFIVPYAQAFSSASFAQALSYSVSDSKELKGVEHDEVLVDDFHTLNGGITFRNGKPALVLPLVSYENGKQFLMTYEGINASGPKLDSFLSPVAKEINLEDYKDIQPATAGFVKNINLVLENGTLTDSEKRRIHFSLAFMYANMVEWKYTDATNTQRTVGDSLTDADRKAGFAKAITELENLNDGTPEAERLLNEAKYIIGAGWQIGGLRYMINGDTAQRKDLKREMKAIEYTDTVSGAATYLDTVTSSFERGEISRSDLVVTLHLMDTVLTRQLAIHNGVIKKGMYVNNHDASEIGYDDIKDQTLFSTHAVLRSMGRAFTALGTGESVQQSRAVVDMSQKLLELAKIVSRDSYSLSEVSGMPAISQPFQAVELTTLVQTLVQNSETVLAKYPLERLALAPETQTQIAALRRDFNDMFVTHYTGLQNASNMGERLSQLLQHIQNKQKGLWTQKDKEFFQALFQETIQSPSDEASRQFLATLLEDGLIVSKPEVVITPFSQTGKHLDFSLTPIAIEEGGVKRSTTLHPVDTLTATFTLQNRLHIPLHFQFAMGLEQGVQDNPREVRALELPPGTSQQLTYTTHVSVVSREEGNSQDWVPKGEVILALNGLKMAVSAPGLRPLAYR